MPLFYPDNLEHNNPNNPLMDVNQLKGQYNINLLSERDSIPLNKRSLTQSVGCRETERIYIYIGSTVNDIDWVNTSNWKSSASDAGGSYLPLSGGTLTGSLLGTSISATTFYGDGSNLTGVVSTHNGLSGLQGGQLNQYYHLTQAEYALVSGNSLDNRYVNVTGDTLTGQLKAPSFSATTYYGSASNLTGISGVYLPLSGGSITGGLSAVTMSATTLYGDGSNLTGIINQVNAKFLPLSGGTLTGSLSGTSISATTFYGNGSNLTNIDHNTTINKQGGQSGQYFHLTQTEYALVSGNSLDNRYVNVTGDTINGLLKSTSLSATSITGGTLYGDGSNLTGIISDHNDLTNIQGGLTNERYHLNISEYSAVSGNSLNLKSMQNVGICKRLNFQPTDISINPTANTISISTVNGVAISTNNPLRYFTDGSGMVKEHVQTTTAVASFTNTTGVWYVHFDSNSNFIATQVPWSDFDLIATVYRFYLNATLPDATKIVVRAYEGHLNVMSAEVHAVLHANGTVHLDGFDLIHNVVPINAGGVPTVAPNADGRNAVISLTNGRNSDDGLEYSVTHSTTPTLSYSQNLGEQSSITLNATNAGLFKIRTNNIGGVLDFLPATRFPFAFNVTTNIPQYITSTGVLTPVPDNQWFVYYVYALQDDKPTEPIKLVSAESSFTTYALAQAHDWINLQNLYATLRDKGIRPLYKLIFYSNSTGGGSYNVGSKYSALVSFTDIRTTKTQNVNASSGGIVLASNVILTPPIGYTSTEVQSFANEIVTNFNLDKDNLTAHTGNTSIHFTKSSINLSDLGNTAHTHTIANITNLQSSLDGKLSLTGGTITGSLSATTFYGDGSNLTGVVSTHNGLSGLQGGQLGQYYHLNRLEYSQVSGTSIFNSRIDFNSHTGDTSVHYPKSGVTLSQLGDSAHTHNITDIPVFPSTLTPDKMLKVNSGGTAFEETVFTADQVLNTSDIDVSDPSWIEQEVRLVTVKKDGGQPSLDGAAELMDLMLPPSVLSTLEASDANWVNETKTVTGDNSTYALGRLGQIGWLSDRTFVQCTTAAYMVSGSATFNRNRAVDSLDANDSQDAIVINQLDRSYTYPAMTPTGNSTDLGWDLLTQTKVLNNTTYPAKLGTWFVGGINGAGYNYYCYAITGGNSYWKRNGQAEAVQRMITTSSHPNLTSALLAFDFSAGRYTQTGLEVSYQDQTFQDTTSGKYFIKVTNTQWDLFVNRDDLNAFYTHTGDTSIHFTKSTINFSDLGSTAHTHTIANVSNLQTSLDNKTNLTLFNAHTATTNAHQVSFNNLTSTAHTHTVSEISDFPIAAIYNVTSWQEIVDILAVSTVPNSVVFNVMNDIVGGTLQTYAHNIIIRGCKVTAPSTFSILGFENGIYNINFESLYYNNNASVIVVGNDEFTTTINIKFKDITSLWYNTSTNYNLQCIKGGTGTTASIEYNTLTNTKLDTSTTLVPTQNNNYYKWNYYYDIYMFNIDSEIHFLCDRAGKFSVRCRYICSTTTNRIITLIPPLPLKLCLHDFVTSAIETLGSYPNPIIYGTETINKFRYDTEPLSYGSSGTIFTDLNDKIEYRNNFGIGSAQYTDTGGIVDISTSGLTLKLNYTGNASGYVKKEIVITGVINRKL